MFEGSCIEGGILVEPYFASWIFDGDGYSEAPPPIDNPRSGMYYEIGHVGYSFDEAKQDAVYYFQLGPRYGRGFKKVFGASQERVLDMERQSQTWIS